MSTKITRNLTGGTKIENGVTFYNAWIYNFATDEGRGEWIKKEELESYEIDWIDEGCDGAAPTVVIECTGAWKDMSNEAIRQQARRDKKIAIEEAEAEAEDIWIEKLKLMKKIGEMIDDNEDAADVKELTDELSEEEIEILFEQLTDNQAKKLSKILK